MVYVPARDLVNPAVVHPTSISSSITPTATPTHSSTATKTTATSTSGTPPLTTGTTSKTTNATHPPLQHSTCDSGCKATLGILIPVVLLSVVAIIVYFAWGRTFLRQRKERKAKAVEEGIAMRKLGDEGSVSEWEGDGEMRDVAIAGEGGNGVRKSKTGRWWKK